MMNGSDSLIDDTHGLSDEQLELVARNGSGPLERTLATVLLAKRQNRMDELQELAEQSGGVTD